MPWAIRLRKKKTTEVCSSYGMHRGTVAVLTGFEPAISAVTGRRPLHWTAGLYLLIKKDSNLNPESPFH